VIRLYAYLVLFKSLTKTTFQLLYGVWKISKLTHPIVTIFGGSRVRQDSRYAHMAHKLSHLLIEDDISVITGGGPGIMEAANCGASDKTREQFSLRNIGITVKGLDEEVSNLCAQEIISLDYFFARKWLMINYSVAFAVFPGGFGTLEEMAEVATLMQTKKLPGAPVILLGKDYWQPFMDWLNNSAVTNGLVSREEMALLYLTDDVHEAHVLMKNHCKNCS
jgi:uncharacterized protein (TIGR00730 family)